MNKPTHIIFTLIFSLFIPHVSAQKPAAQIFVFGDSLVDNGNLEAFTEDPNIPKRFTNGLLSVDLLARHYGLSLTPSLHLLPNISPSMRGNNYAVAGARSLDEDGNELTADTNFPTQINAFLQHYEGTAPSDALYIISIGGNDIRDSGINYSPAVSFSSFTKRWKQWRKESKRVLNAVESQVAQIEKLILAGAQNILVMIPPDLGSIPETKFLSEAAVANAKSRAERRLAKDLPAVFTGYTLLYDAALILNLEILGYEQGIRIKTYNMFEALDKQIHEGNANENLITDEPCVYAFTQGGLINARCDDFPEASRFLFWDEVHSTQPLHTQMAEDMIKLLENGG